ncbi:MAG TPA: DUF5700 domain-containing putative Zn-dependent protease [Blastocatellia bacterium]|nr:DUF5700 domain-containing putative Zn-dependent protease [Blastocatellia bacterium]
MNQWPKRKASAWAQNAYQACPGNAATGSRTVAALLTVAVGRPSYYLHGVISISEQKEPATLRKSVILLCAISFLSPSGLLGTRVVGDANSENRIRLTLDSSEAEQVFSILALRREGKAVSDAEWQTLFATEAYQRLKKREQQIAEMYHQSDLVFTDEDFKKFVLSLDPQQQAAELQTTLDKWKTVDLRGSAERVLTYLPHEATINAKVYPLIKPRHNSFVFEPSTNPAIMLYLDPSESSAKFENTVAHELHHIGLGSLGPVYDKKLAGLPERAHEAAEWMGAFGEGMAMLAAAGGPDVDPHAASSEADRKRWQHDLANFNADLQSVDAFFLDTLSGKLGDKSAVTEKASTFFGVQGPWYTVGYRMCVMVEKRFGRDKLIETMLDPRQLLVLYNSAATEHNATLKEGADASDRLPLWSGEMLKQVGAE